MGSLPSMRSVCTIFRWPWRQLMCSAVSPFCCSKHQHSVYAISDLSLGMQARAQQEVLKYIEMCEICEMNRENSDDAHLWWRWRWRRSWRACRRSDRHLWCERLCAEASPCQVHPWSPPVCRTSQLRQQTQMVYRNETKHVMSVRSGCWRHRSYRHTSHTCAPLPRRVWIASGLQYSTATWSAV